ncbi:MAG: hypothetical protein UT81_C0014G0031, partial [Parcubacteria group bacterium GW2011_GWA2_40_14]
SQPRQNPKLKARPHSFPRPLSAGGIQTRISPNFKNISLGFAKSKSPENSFGKTESTELALRIPSVSPLKEKPDLARHHHTKSKRENPRQIKTECVVARRGRSGTAEAEADCRTRQSGGAEAVP